MKRQDKIWKMRQFRFKLYLVVLSLAIVPTIVSYFTVSGILGSAMMLGMDQRIESQLDRAGRNLKTLSKFDPENEHLYKQQFLQLQEVRRTYTFLLDALPSMHRSYVYVFLIIIGIVILSALVLATWLNRKLIQAHDSILEKMKASQEQVFHLKNRESWRFVAQKLVHEIKNPLTPIQVMVARLPGKYLHFNSSSSHGFNSEFKLILDETKQIVNEEIDKVNTWIEAFSRYARMPEPQIAQVNVREFISEFHRHYQNYWENLNITVNTDKLLQFNCSFDPMLMKQVLFNLAKNSAEATQKDVELSIEAREGERGGLTLVFIDNGPGLLPEIKERLFQPSISTKDAHQARGFGLAIVRKIMLEHGGDIRHFNPPQGCGFELWMPL
jgi:signal transduction histidine kinase